MPDPQDLFDEPEPASPPGGDGSGGGRPPMTPAVFQAVTRRGFIVGVASAAAAGAAVGVGGTLGVQALTGGGGGGEQAAATATPSTTGAGGAANAGAATAVERGTIGIPGSTVISDAVVTLNINGQPYSLLVQPQDTLADVLRARLGLTGTKVACNHSECSACTVLVDGVPMNACSLLALREQGKAITTIEGLAQDGQLNPVQQAFVDNMGMQCGFCTSGQVMQSVALLQRNPNPTEADIRAELSGNICKCAAYKNILASVQAAAAKQS